MKKLFNPGVVSSFLIIIVIFGYFSFNAPLMTDNFVFSRDIYPNYAEFYVGGEVSAAPLTIKSAFRQACTMYTTWCGRFTGNLSVYLLFLLPPVLGHILSTIGFAVYILLLHICVFGQKWREHLTWGWILGISALVWLSVPSFGEAFFWLSVGGQIALFAQILMLLPYRLALTTSGSPSLSKPLIAILSILFFASGAFTSSLDYPTSASLPGAALSAVAYIYFLKKKTERKIPWILLCGALGLLIGGLITVLAPGNTQRMLLTNDTAIRALLTLSWPERIWLWLINLPSLLLLLPLPLFLLLWGLFVLYREKGANFWKAVPVTAAFFLLTSLLAIGAFIFTAWPPPRAFAGPSIQLLLCALIICVAAMPSAPVSLLSKWRLLQKGFALYVVFTILWTSQDFYKLHKIILERENIIAASPGEEVILPALAVRPNRFQPLGGELADISSDPKYWVNRAMSIHYGLKSVRRAPLVHGQYFFQYQQSLPATEENLNINMDYDRFYIKASGETARALLEKGAHIYYFGRPALLSKLWAPIADDIFTWLASLRENDPITSLVPVLMARTDLHETLNISESYEARSPIIQLYNPDTIWLVRPGEDKLSFNLIKFEIVAESSEKSKSSAVD